MSAEGEVKTETDHKYEINCPYLTSNQTCVQFKKLFFLSEKLRLFKHTFLWSLQKDSMKETEVITITSSYFQWV